MIGHEEILLPQCFSTKDVIIKSLSLSLSLSLVIQNFHEIKNGDPLTVGLTARNSHSYVWLTLLELEGFKELVPPLITSQVGMKFTCEAFLNTKKATKLSYFVSIVYFPPRVCTLFLSSY